MLKVDQYEHIRTAFRVYHKKIKTIARETGHSKNTVKKAVRGELSGYTTRQHQPCPVLDPYKVIIDRWLEADLQHESKQRHTARRIYNRLCAEHDYAGAESTVRRYVREAKSRLGLSRQSVFIPSAPLIGQEAEVDWGTMKVVIQGHPEQVKVFMMRSKYSGKHFVRCYPCERQQAFFDAHVHAFAFFGGVFPVLIYDNLTSAVRKVFQGRQRELQENFRRFQAYYTFTPRFCNPAQGHEKGGVEGLVGYVRRNYFVPRPEVVDLAALNARLLEQCHQYGQHRLAGREDTVQASFSAEQDQLVPLPAYPFSNLEEVSSKVDKYATVLVDKNRYSVPTRYAQQRVSVVLSVARVEVHADRRKIASHERVYGNNKWQLEPDHYLDLIQQRPQSFSTARPLQRWRERWPVGHERLLTRFCQHQGQTKGIKDFISVLKLYREHEATEVETAVELALEALVSTSEGVIHLVRHTFQAGTSTPSLPDWPTLPPASVSAYGQLGGIR